jgi:hypothetical protein
MVASMLAAVGEALAELVGAAEAEMVEAVGHVAYEGTAQVAQLERVFGPVLAVREQTLIPRDIGKAAAS